MRYLAILKDSLIQTLDCKSFYVMMAVAGLFILLCASISYSPMDERAAIQDMVDQFRVVTRVKGFDVNQRNFTANLAVGELRTLGEDAGRFGGGYGFALTVTGRDEWCRLVRHWDATKRGLVKKEGDPVPDADVEPDEELEAKFFRDRFREQMIRDVEVKRASVREDERVFDMRLKPYSKQTFQGASRAHILFGLWSFRLPPPFSVSMFVFVLESVLSEWGAGLIGVLVALVFTGGFVPNMLQKGSLDVLLARPVRRTTLLLLKYVGGLTYGVVSGAFFIGGSWLALSARSGVWNWGYLASLGTLVFFFAVLYSVGVLFAVMTRSTIAAIVMPGCVWAVSSGVDFLRKVLLLPDLAAKIPKAVWTFIDGVYYILPKPSSLNDINKYLMWKGSFGAATEGAEMQVPEIAWASVIISQAIFALVLLGGACWIFSRRDH